MKLYRPKGLPLRWAALAALILATSLPLSAAEADLQSPHATISPKVSAFLQANCARCHGPEEQNAEIRFDTMPTVIADEAIAQRWQDVLDVLNLSEMPPEQAAQPDPAELADLLETLTADLREARRRLTDSGGRVILRRLNRREYQQTIETLFGVPVDVSMLPDDGTVDGFDTLGQAHSFSSLHLERYLDIGRKVLDDAYGVGKPRSSRPYKRHSETEGAAKKIKEEIERLEQKLRQHEEQIANGKKNLAERVEINEIEIGLSKEYLARTETKDGVLLPFKGLNPIPSVAVGKQAATGEYRVRVRCGVASDEPTDQVFLGVVRGEYRAKVPDELFHFQVTGTRSEPQVIEFTVDIDNIRSDRLAFQRRSLARDILDRFAGSRDYYFKYKDVAYLLEDELPDLWIDWIEVEGPLDRPAAPLSAEKLIGDDEANLSDENARTVLERFAFEAFRRSAPDPQYVDRLMHVYLEARTHGAEVKAALKDAMAVVLASPRFLFLYEPAVDGEKARPLTDREVAVRLSYFLWSAPPDDELYSLADAKKLRDPRVLAEQVDRMIASPRANLFIETFATQWLELERLDGIDPANTPSKHYDAAVQEHSRQEVFAFFAALLREDLPLTNLLDSEFVFVDALMAEYYGIAGVRGDAFGRVDLPGDSVRGGLLGQSAILTLTGTGERTSPVERGVFVLRKLLDRPPPPAPANVPMLDEESVGTRSIRETLAVHMSSPQCNSCHRRIDPLGFALENFDPVGRWRTKVHASNGTTQFDIDASGVMPDGEREFADLHTMKAHLATERDALLEGITKALMTYALGRTIGFSDQDQVEEITRETAAEGYRARTLIHKIVQSEPFLSK